MALASHRKDRSASPQLEPIAGNGLLDRRALLGRGIVFAQRSHDRRGTSLTDAAAEPLTVDPWSLAPGVPIPPYGQPSKYENNVVRTLTNPNNEARGSAARTPHHLLNGTITPNGLHFVVARGGFPDIDPDKHRLVIHGLVKQPMVFTLDALARYPMVSRIIVRRMRRQQRTALFQRSRSRPTCRPSTDWPPAPNGPACRLSTLLRGNRHRSEGEVVHRRRRGRFPA